MNLYDKKCVPCEGWVNPFDEAQIKTHLSQLRSKWGVLDATKIKKEFKFKDFREAMIFVNKVAELAETEGHHPDIHISYDKIIIELWTHAIRGLSENDFIMAAKIEKLKI